MGIERHQQGYIARRPLRAARRRTRTLPGFHRPAPAAAARRSGAGRGSAARSAPATSRRRRAPPATASRRRNDLDSPALSAAPLAARRHGRCARGRRNGAGRYRTSASGRRVPPPTTTSITRWRRSEADISARHSSITNSRSSGAGAAAISAAAWRLRGPVGSASPAAAALSPLQLARTAADAPRTGPRAGSSTPSMSRRIASSASSGRRGSGRTRIVHNHRP